MDKRWNCMKGGAKLTVFTLAIGMLVTGCGGGGSGGSATVSSVTAVASYVADTQAGGGVGNWSFVGSTSSVASAGVNTLAATATANTYTYNYTDLLMTNRSWGADPNPWTVYDLQASGWVVSPSTGILVDSGDGSHITITPAGDVAVGAAVTKTSLANTPIVCKSPSTGATVACAAPGNYPAGAVSYLVSYNAYASDRYSLVGSAGGAAWLPVTDATGGALTGLPAVGATFCDPNLHAVFKAIMPAPAAGIDNYNAYGTTSCSAADIATAIGFPAYMTALISNQVTGNGVVANVLRIQVAAGTPYASWTNTIYGLRAGNVWYGWMSLAGSAGNSGVSYNKTAVNAELLASGLVALP
jgi:hypothetical protein